MKLSRSPAFFVGAVLCIALGLSGAREAERPALATVAWPPPPAAARIITVGTYSSAAELGMGPTMADRILTFFTGASRGRERFSQPFGLAVDEEGNLCLSDTGTKAVWFFDLKRSRGLRWDEIDRVPFGQPVAVAKARGILYVADAGLGQVVAFDVAGHARFRLKTPLIRPAGLALFGEKLYVADAGAHCVRIYDPQGQALGQLGQRGSGPGDFNFPTHVATDGQGRLYVTDALNARVQVFTPDGQFLTALGKIGDGSGHFSRPKGVAVDRHNHVYVTDVLFDNLQLFDPSGAFLLDVGTTGSAVGEFWMPSGIAITRDDRIYIADTRNARVQVLRYLGQP